MVLNIAFVDKLVLRLEVSHVTFGGMCLAEVMFYTAWTPEESGQPLLVPGKLLFYLLVTFTMLVVSVLMLIACLAERWAAEGEKHYKSLFEVMLYGMGCFLYFAATLSLIMYIVDDASLVPWSYKWTSYVGAAMSASWNTIAYMISLWAFVKLRSLVRLERKDSDTAGIVA